MELSTKVSVRLIFFLNVKSLFMIKKIWLKKNNYPHVAKILLTLSTPNENILKRFAVNL